MSSNDKTHNKQRASHARTHARIGNYISKYIAIIEYLIIDHTIRIEDLTLEHTTIVRLLMHRVQGPS